MLFQFAQLALANVIQLLEWIEMNIMEERMITFGFNKKTPKSFLTPSIQQPKGQPNKTMFQKGKGTKYELGGSTSYSTK